MRKASKAIVIMTLILLMGFSTLTSSNLNMGTSMDHDSLGYKLKHMDVYVEKTFKSVYNYLTK